MRQKETPVRSSSGTCFPMPPRSEPSHPFLAGGLAGVLEICLTYPLEFVKNSLQLQPGRYTGPVDAARVLTARHGASVVYRGLPSWLLFAFPRSSIRYTSFGFFSGALEHGGAFAGVKEDTIRQLARDGVAGILAGAIEAVTCLAPCQNLSIKITHDANLPVGERSFSPRFFPAAGQIFMRNGVRGMLAGVGPTLFKNCLNQSIRFPGFFFFSRAYCENEGVAREHIGMLPLLACGSLAGAASAIVSHPVDVVKAQMMGLHAGRYRNSVHCARSVFRESGPFAFFVGLGPRLTRVCMEVGLLFSLFEYINRFLDHNV